MQEGKENREDRKELAKIYDERLEKAKKGRGYQNCAGFVAYMLGINEKETFIRPDDISNKGLLPHLKQISILPIDEFEENKYLENSQQADVAAILHNKNLGSFKKWTYLHFFIPHPDKDHRFEIYQRNGFEEENAEVVDIREILKDPEYKGESIIVFFKKK